MNPRIIGFSGQMGVGKSTAIEALKTRCIRGGDKNAVHLIKFAGPLYEMQEFIYRRIQTVYQRPEGFTKDRKLLQWLGTEFGRNSISQTLWVDLWKEEARYALENYPDAIIVCDDVRFDNEAETVRSMGGLVVRITSEASAARIDTTSGIKNHASEAGVSQRLVDFLVTNDNTKEDFESELNNGVFKLLTK